MKIEKRNDGKEVFAQDVDYGTVVLINNQPYMCIKRIIGGLSMLPFINLESGEIDFFVRMTEVLKVEAKLVID